MKKRAMTLLEVLIGLGLLSILLSTLFFAYRLTHMGKEKLGPIQWPLSEERYAYQRLQKILPKATLPFFTSGPDSLVFIFDRGIWSDPLLSHNVVARLYFDPTAHALRLGIWPDVKKTDLTTPSQTVTLLDRVTSVSFAFYFPPRNPKKIVDPDTINAPRPLEKWGDIWLGDYQVLPALVKVTIVREKIGKMEERSLEYLFDLSSTIVYPKEIL